MTDELQQSLPESQPENSSMAAGYNPVQPKKSNRKLWIFLGVAGIALVLFISAGISAVINTEVAAGITKPTCVG
jgi:hypothetical protein